MQYHSFDLEERLMRFAVQVLNLIEKLPNSTGARVLANQLARSCTSAALNYGEAQAKESAKDFIHKMSVCLKELRESQMSLKIISYKPYVTSDVVDPVLKECSELVAIFVTSINTKRKGMNR
jgi:four helix bundle protein